MLHAGGFRTRSRRRKLGAQQGMRIGMAPRKAIHPMVSFLRESRNASLRSSTPYRFRKKTRHPSATSLEVAPSPSNFRLFEPVLARRWPAFSSARGPDFPCESILPVVFILKLIRFCRFHTGTWESPVRRSPNPRQRAGDTQWVEMGSFRMRRKKRRTKHDGPFWGKRSEPDYNNRLNESPCRQGPPERK